MTGESEDPIVNATNQLYSSGDKIVNFIDNRSCTKPSKRVSKASILIGFSENRKKLYKMYNLKFSRQKFKYTKRVRGQWACTTVIYSLSIFFKLWNIYSQWYIYIQQLHNRFLFYTSPIICLTITSWNQTFLHIIYLNLTLLQCCQIVNNFVEINEFYATFKNY